MKENISLVLVILALILCTWSIYNVSNLRSENEALKNKLQNNSPTVPEEEIEIAAYMSALQTHFSKLYFAGRAENPKLAAFYAHEMEESFEHIVEAKIFEEGQNISSLAEQFGLDPIERFEKEINENGLVDFDEKYSNIINNCNSCHLKTAHEFIQIVIPNNPPVGNQKFTLAGQ